MIVSHIVAVSENFVIGTDNRLPWRMPDDMAYFHRMTRGHVVIMGRKNYEANGKALKNRINIVITRNPDFRPGDAHVVGSLEESLELAGRLVGEKKATGDYPPEEEVFIVGGGEIYAQSLQLADRIYITVIFTEVEGDTRYPEINFEDYELISREDHRADERNPYDWSYFVLGKR